MRATGKRGRAGDPEAGFVMLMVFVMAAAIAIMLYMELPRVSFEAQRNKEALLIERGEQYKRAIQLYFRKFKRYPTSMEQLESTNNLRFLRRRYKDPLTGKDEWRLIHIGPTGAFIDSLTNKPGGNDKDKKPANLNTFITEGGGIGAGLPTTGANNGQPPRRASEQAALNAALDPTAGGTIPNPAGNPVVGGQLLNPQGGSPFPTSIPAGVVPVSAFNLPAQTGTPGIAPDGSMQPAGSGFGSSAGQGFGNSGFGNSGGQGFGQSQGQGFGQQGQQQGFNAGQPGANQAANLMLSQLLTTPRNTNNFVTPGPGLGTPAVGGGIAGVASTIEKTGIKIYNERSKYNEWEFIYDFGKDRTGMGQLAGQMGSADPRLANSGQNSQSGFGGQGGLGQSGIGQAGQGGAFGGQAGAQAGFGGAGGFGRTGAGQAGATGGIGSSAGGVGSGYGGGIGSGFTPPPASQAQPARQPATPQQQPAPQPHPQQAQPAQPQPVQPAPQPAPPPQPEPTSPVPEPTPEPAPDPQAEVAPPVPDPPVPDPPPVVETPPQ